MVHVVTLAHVVVSFHHVLSGVTFGVTDHHLTCHFAVNSSHHIGIIAGNSGFHHLKIYHALVGSLGAVSVDSYFASIGSTSLHPFELNVIVYLFLL